MSSGRGAARDSGLGDPLERIARDHWSDLLQPARRHGPGPELAPDIVMAAMAKVLSGQVRLRDGDRGLLPSLLEVIANEACNRRRYEAVRRTEPLEDAECRFLDGGDGAAKGWHLYQRLCFRRDLAEALGELTPDQREVATARLLEDLSVREIAERRGCSVSTVKTHWSRAVAKLRAALKVWFDP